jgi:ubiquinone/menaquinone biosynthesis C-methylase UbiE
MLDESQQVVTSAAAAVEQQGSLAESFASPLTSLPFDTESFDVVVIRNVLPHLDAARRQAVVGEVARVIRPGGRALIIDDSGPKSGLAGLLGGRRGDESHRTSADAAPLFMAAGFRGVRTLAEREGIVFVEGVKPGGAGSQSNW